MSVDTIIQACKLRFHRIPRKARQIGIIAMAILMAWFCASSIIQWHHRSQPTYVLEILDRVNTPEDIQQYDAYFTPQGKAILTWMLAKANNRPSSGAKPAYSEPLISGTTCDIRGCQDKVFFTIRLTKTNRWQFHDIYIDTVENTRVDMWVSYMKGHPWTTYWKINWRDLLGAFFTGWNWAAAAK